MLRTSVALSLLIVCGVVGSLGSIGWAATPLHGSGSAEIEASAGYDTNLFLQIAASPDSPNYHAYRGAFLRANPMLSGAAVGRGFRLELRYGADVIHTFGDGTLYLQDAELSLVVPEIGRLGARLVATGGRFDAGQFASDAFWSWGGRAQLAARVLQSLRAAATYEIDRRQFVDATALQLRGDSGQSARLAVIWSPSAVVDVRLDGEYLALRSDVVDPTQSAGELHRWRAGPGVAYVPLPTVTASASLYAGRQSTESVETDRQWGGALAVAVRASSSFDVVGRCDVLLNRAVAPASDYSRQVVTLAVVGHLAPATPARSSTPADRDEAALGEQAPLVQGARARFRVRAPGAATVAVIGSWNDWASDRPEQNLRATADPELWEGWLAVGAGDHHYHFLVDGRPVRPVDAPRYLPDGFGGEDGVLAVDADSVYRR